MTRWIQRFAWTVLALGGAATWGVAIGWLNPVHPPDLDALPSQLGSLRTLEVYPVDSGLLGDLPPDRYTFRRVGDESGRAGEFYVAYFERGRRWSGRPHDVDVCYRAGGWEAEAPRTLTTASGARLQAQDFHKDEAKIRVFYWIQQPGFLPGEAGITAHLRRMLGPAILRQDVASIYFQFPSDQAPADAEVVAAADVLMRSLDALWR
jgi:hypothetical protein